MSKLLPLLLAAGAGFSIVTQQLLNATLRAAIHSAAWTGFASYVVGTLCMALLALSLRDPLPAAGLMAGAPWWAWSGGFFGAIFIGLGIFLVPQLGAATFFALLITGQMVGSLIFDHFGLFGLVQRSVDLPRLLGVALLVAGVILVRR